jgi:hypothetical protein
MLAVLSPAKSLDFETEPTTTAYSTSDFLDETVRLVTTMKRKRSKDLMRLMSISEKLAELNVARYAEFEQPVSPGPLAKQAAFAFTGHTYVGFDAGSMNDADLDYAQRHVRILSGLYGILKPLDLIYPYRLEMGTRLKTRRGDSLYKYWGDRLAKALSVELKSHSNPTIVNCASNEYFAAINRPNLDATVITPVFKDKKGDDYKIISFFAKEARGAMAAFIVRNQIETIDGLKDFSFKGYGYSPTMSSEAKPAFCRDGPPS